MKIGILGAGFTGKAIGRRFAEKNMDVWGSTRSADKFDLIEKQGIRPVLYGGAGFDQDLLAQCADVTHLIVSIAPPRLADKSQPHLPVDPVLRGLAAMSIKQIMPKLQWVAYLSTVGVYGNHDGAWIDETSPLKPVSERSQQRLKAENEWQALAKADDLPLGIFRLSGIYGPGRNALINAFANKSRRLIKKDQVFNRIYVEDIAQGLCLALEKKAKGVFNITDDLPAPPQDVVTYAHDLLGKRAPEEIDFETADLSPMARSFYGENKRVSNQKSKQELGLIYQWPTYKAALDHMFDNDIWQK